MSKKTLFIFGLFCSILILSGLPAYFVSSQSGPISQQAIFYYMWGFFSAPSGIISLVWLIQWYREKKYT
jgi:hypothetical protein